MIYYCRITKFINPKVKKIVEFALEDGDSVLIEVSQSNDRIGIPDRITEKANKTFESALNTVKPIANTIMDKILELNQPASEVEVKFGIKMTAGLGAIVASGSADINYEITLKWKQET
jgi:hypothetical protein